MFVYSLSSEANGWPVNMASLQSVDQEVPTWIDAASEESSIGVKVKLRVTTGQACALGHDGARAKPNASPGAPRLPLL